MAYKSIDLVQKDRFIANLGADDYITYDYTRFKDDFIKGNIGLGTYQGLTRKIKLLGIGTINVGNLVRHVSTLS